jgi:hypothetical protein
MFWVGLGASAVLIGQTIFAEPPAVAPPTPTTPPALVAPPPRELPTSPAQGAPSTASSGPTLSKLLALAPRRPLG